MSLAQRRRLRRVSLRQFKKPIVRPKALDGKNTLNTQWNKIRCLKTSFGSYYPVDQSSFV